MNHPAPIPTPSVCESVPPARTSARLWIGILAVAMSGLALWMLIDLKQYPCEHSFHHQIDSPALAIELASTREEAATVLRPTCTSQANPASAPAAAHSSLLRNTIQDCFFIPLYTLFIWSSGSLFAVQKDRPWTTSRRILTGATIATAVSDYVENVGIFRLLCFGPSDTLARWTCWPSRIKWIMFALSLLVTAVILLRSQNKMYSIATRRLFAIAYLVIGILLVVGIWRPVLIGLGTITFAVIVLLQIAALLGPYVGRLFPPDHPKYEDDFCERKEKEKVDLAVHE